MYIYTHLLLTPFEAKDSLSEAGGQNVEARVPEESSSHHPGGSSTAVTPKLGLWFMATRRRKGLRG